MSRSEWRRTEDDDNEYVQSILDAIYIKETRI